MKVSKSTSYWRTESEPIEGRVFAAKNRLRVVQLVVILDVVPVVYNFVSFSLQNSYRAYYKDVEITGRTKRQVGKRFGVATASAAAEEKADGGKI
jgi:hypothetical protein